MAISFHIESLEQQGYRNRDEVAGLSVKHTVSWNDEWCAEAYMNTDYSALTVRDIDATVGDFLAFNVMKEIVLNLEKETASEEN
jgi:type I restriction enzyme M protein